VSTADLSVPHLGLALPSGAARGAAHVGVLLALEEAGLAVDVVAGTSAGALIGGAWAAGVPAAEIADRILAARWPDFAAVTPSARLGLLDTGPMLGNLAGLLGDARIEELPITFGAVVTELISTRPRLVTTGPLVEAILASAAVPGLFPPVLLGGRRCLDGGVLSPHPVWAARALGADRVIGVVLGRGPRWRRWYESLPSHPARDQRADLVIPIDTEGASAWSADDVPRLVDIGYHAAAAALAEPETLCSCPDGTGTDHRTFPGGQGFGRRRPARLESAEATAGR